MRWLGVVFLSLLPLSASAATWDGRLALDGLGGTVSGVYVADLVFREPSDLNVRYGEGFDTTFYGEDPNGRYTRVALSSADSSWGVDGTPHQRFYPGRTFSFEIPTGLANLIWYTSEVCAVYCASEMSGLDMSFAPTAVTIVQVVSNPLPLPIVLLGSALLLLVWPITRQTISHQAK